MHFLVIDYFRSAVSSLKATKTRTFLTTLGIAIGIASITIVLSLSSGMTQVIAGQVDKLGGNIAVVRPGGEHKGIDLAQPITQQAYNTSTLTEQDVASLEQLPGAQAAPLMLLSATLKADDYKVPSGRVLATTPSLQEVNKLPISDGQFFDKNTAPNTAVLGPELSVELFGTEQSIGKVFSAGGQKFRVIGILKHTDDPVNFNNVDFDNIAIIPIESGKSFHQGIVQIQQINLRANNVAELPGVIDAAKKALAKNHGGEEDFTILSGEMLARPANQLLNAMTGIMTAIAAISLVVGGIGVMNIMLVNVAERTREVGVRKAVGASTAHIVSQFVIEALIMSVVGGILGYFGGYAIAFVISTFLTFDPAFTWQIAGVALGVSIVVGVLFGLYPALRAAQKHPIEALRQYH